MPDTIIFDIDGTLVDSNYQHALAWYRALRRYHITVPLWQIHRAIGDDSVLMTAEDRLDLLQLLREPAGLLADRCGHCLAGVTGHA